MLTEDRLLQLKKYKQSGNEHIYFCLKCGRKKLYVNFQKKVYNCFRCGFQGHLSQDSITVNHPEYILPFKLSSCPFNVCGISNLDIEWKYLNLRGISDERIRDMKCFKTDDFKYKNRIIIPIIEDKQEVVWVARAINNKEPKELTIGNKSNYLYNLDSIGAGDYVVVTEGIFDCEAVLRGTHYKCVSILGSRMSDVQIGKLIAKNPMKIILFLDNDEAGLRGTKKIAKDLMKRFRGSIGITNWLDLKWKDPGETPPEIIKKLIN